jgi:cation diffusion facilitator CzcD-associated flavoprotein CzcO
VPIVPQLEGLDDFAGEMYYTARWPREPVSFEGRRVAVIGTGASGMQTIQTVVDQGVDELFVFQRTANFAIPARNRPLDDDEQREYKAHYPEHRARSLASGFGVGLPFVGTGRTADLSEEEFERRFVDADTFGGSAVLAAFPDVLMDEESNERVSERIRQDIRSRVDDPEIAELLCPRGHFLGARRLLIETSYLEAFNQPNVHLIDVRAQPIERLTKTSSCWRPATTAAAVPFSPSTSKASAVSRCRLHGARALGRISA